MSDNNNDSQAKDAVFGYKGFDMNLRCRGMQYTVGETVVHDGNIRICLSGLHFCEDPLDIFKHYAPASSRFAEVVATDVSEETDDDSKRVARSLRLTSEISLSGLIQAGIKFRFDKVDWSKAEETNKKEKGAANATGYRGAANATGDRGAANATGYRGAANATGYRGAANATGEDGISISSGIAGIAKAAKGNWIVLCEWELTDKWHRKTVKTALVDGKKIKADTWYILKDGKFTEVK